MFTGKKLVVFWANIWLFQKQLKTVVGSAHREELTHLCWIWG
jgi:hypothetical protein